MSEQSKEELSLAQRLLAAADLFDKLAKFPEYAVVPSDGTMAELLREAARSLSNEHSEENELLKRALATKDAALADAAAEREALHHAGQDLISFYRGLYPPNPEGYSATKDRLLKALIAAMEIAPARAARIAAAKDQSHE